MSQFVEVVFPLPLDTTFTYDVPSNLKEVQIGHRVLVPFHKRKLTGYVINIPAEAGGIQTKPVQAVLDDLPLLNPDLISLAKKMSELYGASLGECIQTILPAGLTRQTRRRIFATNKIGDPEHSEEKRLLTRIRKSKGLDWIAWVRKSPKAVPYLNSLERSGWIRVETVLRPERAKDQKKKILKKDAQAERQTFVNAPAVKLTQAQENAVAQIVQAIQNPPGQPFLLHGVTGSGKTEVYLQVTELILKAGKNVLALVPEISLTPQFLGRFRARFGNDVAVLHSALSETERLLEWKRIRRGQARVVIGARSAVFAPLEKIGLVIVDEEHDPSYKQDEGLSYHAKDLAFYRSETAHAVLLLGSATPSIETYDYAKEGKFKLLELGERVTGQPLPEVQIVDVRSLFSRYGEKGLISEDLRLAIEETLKQKEQAILFLNRRGFSPYVFCPREGECLSCPNCSVSLTFHKRTKTHLCHYCGYSSSEERFCPRCKENHLVFLGTGTERVEEEVRYLFPDVRVSRMDRDTVRKKNRHESILSDFYERKFDVLIGTQMVTKGIDFPGVALVGVLFADQSLHFPDFRSAEWTFHLLTQVIGRSGRGKRRGQAILQTFQPHHYAIESAAQQDYQGFFEKEVRFRKELRYPPFSSLTLIELKGVNQMTVKKMAQWFADQTKAKVKEQESEIEVLGPASAPLLKINRWFRYHLLIRSSQGSLAKGFSRWLVSQARKSLESKKVFLRLDVDPYRFL